MSAIYMTKFTSSFPDTETVDDWCNVWAEHMADLTGEQLRYGLDRVAKECEWPPSLVEFRQLCEAAPKPPQARLAPPVFARTEFADAALEKIRTDQANAPALSICDRWPHEVLAKADSTPAARDMAHAALAAKAARKPNA
jgi:hypothetical protein